MAQKCEMKLLGKAGSAFANRVRCVLKLKSIEYEYFEEDLDKKSELLLKSNPYFQNVPVLFHANGPPIIESRVIMEYLDEIKPHVHPILPSNPSDRIQSRVLAYTLDTEYYPIMRKFIHTKEDEKREEMKESILQGIGLLEQAFVYLSKGKPFFGGDNIGYMDIVLGSFLGWFKLFRIVFDFVVIDEARNPRLAQWEKNMWSHEVASVMISSHEVHMKFLKFLHNRMSPMSRPIVDWKY